MGFKQFSKIVHLGLWSFNKIDLYSFKFQPFKNYNWYMQTKIWQCLDINKPMEVSHMNYGY
jgi:hypothetical protein